MNVILCNVIHEQTFSPQIVMIVEKDGQFLEYPPTILKREIISELKWMDVNDGLELVYSLIISENIKPVIRDPEDLIIKYPSCKPEILPYLRDKKLDELL